MLKTERVREILTSPPNRDGTSVHCKAIIETTGFSHEIVGSAPSDSCRPFGSAFHGASFSPDRREPCNSGADSLVLARAVTQRIASSTLGITRDRAPGEIVVDPSRFSRIGDCGAAPVSARLGAVTPPAEPTAVKRNQILAFIAAHAAYTDLTPECIARRTGVSRTKLYRMLEPQGGVAACVRQQRLRMMRSALAHRGDARSIEAIAHASGFCSAAHASRSFRKAFGMPPSSFRRAGLPTRDRPTAASPIIAASAG